MSKESLGLFSSTLCSFNTHHTRLRAQTARRPPVCPSRLDRVNMSSRLFVSRVVFTTTRRAKAFSSSPPVHSVETNTGAAIDDALHHHGREDMYFRSEDVRLLQGLVNKAHAQARSRAVDKASASSSSKEAVERDLEALGNIVGKDTLTTETAKRVVAWKRGSFNQAPDETTVAW